MMQESKMTTEGMFTESCFPTAGDMKASEVLSAPLQRDTAQGKQDNRASPGVFQLGVLRVCEPDIYSSWTQRVRCSTECGRPGREKEEVSSLQVNRPESRSLEQACLFKTNCPRRL